MSKIAQASTTVEQESNCEKGCNTLKKVTANKTLEHLLVKLTYRNKDCSLVGRFLRYVAWNTIVASLRNLLSYHLLSFLEC